MRWCTYVSPRDGKDHAGVLDQGAVHGMPGRVQLIELLDQGLAQAAREAREAPFEVLDPANVRFRAPIPVPPSIRDFMAFEEHVKTSSGAMGHDVNPVWYELPLFYFSNPAAVQGPYDDVPIAPGSHAFDYELEVAAVVGRRGRDLHPAHAESHIAGYVLLCDWSARDLQSHEMRGHLGPAKGKDTATSLSQWLVTPDELAPHRSGASYDLVMTASVNGRPYSRGSLAAIHWSFAQLLSYASRGTELRPGDLIGSGTVGTGCILELSRVHGSDRYPWLVPGDLVELHVQSLGEIRARIMPAAAVVPLQG